jgi:hypothetical protein
LLRFATRLPIRDGHSQQGVAFEELCDARDSPDLDADRVTAMGHFSGLFGRETACVSWLVNDAVGRQGPSEMPGRSKHWPASIRPAALCVMHIFVYL